MRLLFVNPAIRPDSPLKLPNVGLAYVMSATQRAGIDFDLIDIDAHCYDDNQLSYMLRKASPYDVVALGTLVSHYKHTKQFLKMVREFHPKATIIVGNTLGTSVPKTLLNLTETDICVIGEGELTFVDLLHNLDKGRSLREVLGIAFKENGQYIETSQRPLIANLDTIPFPNYDSLFDMEVYLRGSRHLVANPQALPISFDDLISFPVNTARGCAFHCNFCFHAFQNRKYRHRSPENIVAEIKHWKDKYNINFVNFWDELTFFSIHETERFADVMIEANLGVHWIGACRSELLVRKDGGLRIAQKLRKANCHGLGFALETGDPGILASMNKANTVQEFIEQCHVCHEADIDVYTSIIVGYPQESMETLDKTFRVLEEARVYPSAGFIQLMPGTPMYQMALDRGHIRSEEEYLMRMGDRQDIRINMTKFDDQFLMDYVTKKLIELNRSLGFGVDESSPIKTKTYRAVKKKQGARKDNFMEGFGVAADVLRDSNWTGNTVKC